MPSRERISGPIPQTTKYSKTRDGGGGGDGIADQLGFGRGEWRNRRSRDLSFGVGENGTAGD